MKTLKSKVLIILVLVAISCGGGGSSSSARPDLNGSIWFISKTGTYVNGNEVLTVYQHTPNCNRDLYMFNQDGTLVITKYSIVNGGGCEPSGDSYQWQLNDDVLTLFDGFNDIHYDILKFTSTELKFTDGFNIVLLTK